MANAISRNFSRRRHVLVVVLLLSLLVTGCVGTRMGVDGPALSIIGDDQNILVAYNDFIVQVNPRDGEAVPLRNAEGEIRFNPDSGEPRTWQITGGDFGGAQFFSQPMWYDEQTLIAADYNRRLLQIDYASAIVENPSGVPTTGQIIAGLTTDGERIFLPYSEKDLQAVDAETFEQIWLFETENAVWREPLLHEGVLYFGSLDHYVYAVDAESGEELWRADLEGAVADTPVINEAGDRIYAGSFAGIVAEISVETGEILSSQQADNWVWGSPIIFDDNIYVADLSGSVYAFSTDGGLAELWTARATNAGIAASPLVTKDYVIVGSRNGEVKWLNRSNGNLAFERAVDAEIMTPFLLVEPTETLDIPNSLVIVSTVATDKVLVAFNLENSAELWRYGR